MKRSPLKWIYLGFAIPGLVVPWYFNLQHILNHGLAGFTLRSYFQAGTHSYLSSSITTDFFIGTTPVLVWMMAEAYRLKMKKKWLYFFGTFCLAFSFTCPLFLFFREQVIEKQKRLSRSDKV